MINISIVLYNNSLEEIYRCLDTVTKSILVDNVILVDNSDFDNLAEVSKKYSNVLYYKNKSNVGFGSGHNIALSHTIQENIPYHLVLNADTFFNTSLFGDLIKCMEQDRDIGMLTPKVLTSSNEIYRGFKLLPTPIDLIVRRFFPNFLNNFVVSNYELLRHDPNIPINAPFLSGCFMFIRTEVLADVGLFDERFFLYMEDLDLSRRIHQKYKTIYYPNVCIIHHHSKGSYKKFNLMVYHIVSAIKYFNKWGWFLDRNRRIINKSVIESIPAS